MEYEPNENAMRHAMRMLIISLFSFYFIKYLSKTWLFFK